MVKHLLRVFAAPLLASNPLNPPAARRLHPTAAGGSIEAPRCNRCTAVRCSTSSLHCLARPMARRMQAPTRTAPSPPPARAGLASWRVRERRRYHWSGTLFAESLPLCLRPAGGKGLPLCRFDRGLEPHKLRPRTAQGCAQHHHRVCA